MKNEKEIIERIKFLMSELHLRQVDLAQKLDVDSSNLSKYLNGRMPLSDSLINRFVVNMGVSKQWLLDGTDLPFAKTAPVTDRTVTELPTRRKDATPVYDIDVTAGSMPRAQLFTDEQIVGWIDLPDVGNDCRIVRVSGDSMSPVIRNGDYVALRELTNLQYIYWGQIYVVTLDDYRLIKYVRRNPDPAFVTLRSANREYDDMDIRRDDIRNMMLVQQILHVDTRM
ncbi:MAG: helix-turn-helix transcriptional regulator [Muribaculaceae bacterium]|nr:helix-turn-helix transcriptional regulator [Muribaculaceae bacterium]